VAVRGFSGDSEFLTFSSGAVSGTGAVSMVALVNRLTGTGFRTIVDLSQGASQRLGLQFNGTNLVYVAGGAFPSVDIGWGDSDGWVIVGATRAAGTATPRAHLWRASNDTWTHTNWGSTVGDADPGGDTVRIGEMADFGEFFPGRMALVGWWDRALSDAELEGMTGSLAAWLATAPAALWRLDQDDVATPVLDITGGGADQIARAGTTVVVGDDPPGFVWDTGPVERDAASHTGLVVSRAARVTAAVRGIASHTGGAVSHAARVTAAVRGIASHTGAVVAQSTRLVAAVREARSGAAAVASRAGRTSALDRAAASTVEAVVSAAGRHVDSARVTQSWARRVVTRADAGAEADPLPPRVLHPVPAGPGLHRVPPTVWLREVRL